MHYVYLIPFLIALLWLIGCAPLGPCIDWEMQQVPHSVRMIGEATPMVTWTEPELVCTERAPYVQPNTTD